MQQEQPCQQCRALQGLVGSGTGDLFLGAPGLSGGFLHTRSGGSPSSGPGSARVSCSVGKPGAFLAKDYSTGTRTRLFKNTRRALAWAMYVSPRTGQGLTCGVVGCSWLSLAPGWGMCHHAAPATVQGVTQIIVPALPARARCNYYYYNYYQITGCGASGSAGRRQRAAPGLLGKGRASGAAPCPRCPSTLGLSWHARPVCGISHRGFTEKKKKKSLHRFIWS